MSYEIKSYKPDFIKKQVDLIWNESGKWKYPYATSYEQLEKSYGSENFDPTTRFYAVEGDKLLGFVTAAVVKDEDKGDYGTMRFPITAELNPEIADQLVEKAEARFKELGITTIRAPAGPGMGNTLELAKKYGFEEKSKIFIRSKQAVDEVNVSGNTDGVINYTDEEHETLVKDLYLTKMGMPEKQAIGFYQWAHSNKKRKDQIEAHRTSWKLTEDDQGISGFGYLHRSDQNPENGQFAPIWFKQGGDGAQIIDRILSAHIKELKPHRMKYMQTYLPGFLLQLEPLYNKFGFHYDATYSYEKQL